jgi:hypothetical protein
MSIKEQAQKYYNEMVADLTATAEGKEAFQKAESLVKETLMEWANAKAQVLLGSEADKKAAAIIAKYSAQAIQDVKDALEAKMSSYLIDKLISELKSLVLKYLLPSLL